VEWNEVEASSKKLHKARVSDQIERVHEFIALKGMLAAKTIGIGTLLDFFALK